MIQDKVFDRRDFSYQSLGKHEFRENSFKYCDLTETRFDQSVFLKNDFTHARLIGATFKLSCKQGSNNKLDELNAGLFLYWMQTMFVLPERMRLCFDQALGPNKDRVRALFEQEMGL